MKHLGGLHQHVATLLVYIRHLIYKIFCIRILGVHQFERWLEFRMYGENAHIYLLQAVGHLGQYLEMVFVWNHHIGHLLDFLLLTVHADNNREQSHWFGFDAQVMITVGEQILITNQLLLHIIYDGFY